MKRVTVILMIALGLSATYSCNKLKHIKFERTFTAQLSVAPTDVVNVEHAVFSQDVSTEAQQILNDNETTKDAVNTVKAETVVLTITSPEAQTWSYVKEIHIFLSAPGLKEVEVAFKQNIKEDGKDLELTVRDIELKDYFMSETFKIKATAVHTKPITQEVKIDAKIHARFDANLLEALD